MGSDLGVSFVSNQDKIILKPEDINDDGGLARCDDVFQGFECGDGPNKDTWSGRRDDPIGHGVDHEIVWAYNTGGHDAGVECLGLVVRAPHVCLDEIPIVERDYFGLMDRVTFVAQEELPIVDNVGNPGLLSKDACSASSLGRASGEPMSCDDEAERGCGYSAVVSTHNMLHDMGRECIMSNLLVGEGCVFSSMAHTVVNNVDVQPVVREA
ncbi:hypothetical protein SESBI_33489 [Sesbania bispinosa]|nr:hypothetical protein SESBI_33489 [Sesbania bispinosa]